LAPLSNHRLTSLALRTAFSPANVDALRELIATRLHGIHNPHMLDVGYCVGEFDPLVRSMFGRVCGADVSAAGIAQARIRNPKVQYEACVGETLPYESTTFDLSIAMYVLHHVLPLQRVGFLREILRVVRPGGLVCLIEHISLNPLTRLAVARCEFDRDAVLLHAGRARALMADAGLHDARSHYFLLLPSAAPLARRVERSLRRIPLGAQYIASGIAEDSGIPRWRNISLVDHSKCHRHQRAPNPSRLAICRTRSSAVSRVRPCVRSVQNPSLVKGER
jgi:SAM-dependent methyltransferase